MPTQDEHTTSGKGSIVTFLDSFEMVKAEWDTFQFDTYSCDEEGDII